jgi:hypothetical protein
MIPHAPAALCPHSGRLDGYHGAECRMKVKEKVYSVLVIVAKWA